ncbi:MAG: peptidase M48, partial [Pseudomonadota bacterium]
GFCITAFIELYESGDAEAALPAYRKSNALAPGEPLMMAGLGRVLLALDEDASTREALAILEEARRKDPGDISMLRSLAVAYDRTGNRPMAVLVTAERFAATNRRQDAALHAGRAAQMLPEGSPGWLRAQDILSMKIER